MSKEFTFSDVSEHTSKVNLTQTPAIRPQNRQMALTPLEERSLHGHPRQGLRLHQYVAPHPPPPSSRSPREKDILHHLSARTHDKRSPQLTTRFTTGFVDEHPGGEEVLLDVGGQDSTEAFEDVGHSDEAREILEGLLVGTLKRGVRFLSSLFPEGQHSSPSD